MEFCYNCDIGCAKYRCLQCPTNESSFCVECKDIHNRTKGCREHTYCEIVKKHTTCNNCESSEAKFICRNCDEATKYLCLGCSVIHPKIKAFRGHTVVVHDQRAPTNNIPDQPISMTPDRTSSSSINWISDLMVQLVDTVYFDLSSRPVTDVMFWRTLVVCVVGSVSYYLASRLIFKKYASLVNIALAIGMYQFLQSAKFKVTEADKALVKAKPGAAPTASTFGDMLGSSSAKKTGPLSWKLGGDIIKEEFKDEFWYSTEDKKASLRPRVRPYKSRASTQQGPKSPVKASSAGHE